MTDISSHENQSIFKKKQRISFFTNILMGALIVVNAALAIWEFTANSKSSTFDWAQIVLIVVLCVVMAICTVFIVFQVKMLKPYRATVHNFVAESFENGKILQGAENADFEAVLVGDKLNVYKAGCEESVCLDLSPVKDYTSVCADIFDKVKKYLRAYYFVHGGADNVTLCDKIGSKQKQYKIVENGSPVKNCAKSYFIKNGLIK